MDKYNKIEQKKLKIEIIVVIVSLILINIFTITFYYFDSNIEVNSNSYGNMEIDEIENLSAEQRNLIQGKVIAELKEESMSGFFVFSFIQIVLSSLVGVFLIILFKKNAEDNTLSTRIDKVRSSGENRIPNIKLFGDPDWWK